MKSIKEYLELPYTITVRKDLRDSVFVAKVQELPGCAAHGSTQSEAIENLTDNMEDWIGDCLEAGDPVPEPTEDSPTASGRWLQRAPKSLHANLISLARREGVSFNQMVANLLADAVGAARVLSGAAKHVESEKKEAVRDEAWSLSWAETKWTYESKPQSYPYGSQEILFIDSLSHKLKHDIVFIGEEGRKLRGHKATREEDESIFIN